MSVERAPSGLQRLSSRTPGHMEKEFLPAALEIVESPASPLGRGIAFTIIAFFCAALAWSWFGAVDIIATAPGKLVPTGNSKVVQPLEAGVIREIRAQDGDVVHAGDLLIELDATHAIADRDRALHDVTKARLDVARLLALRSDSDPAAAAKSFVPPQGASADAIVATRDFIWAQASEQADKVAAFDRQIDEKSARTEEVRATIEMLKATMPLLEQKEAIRAKLLASQAGDRFQWLAAEQELIENSHNLTAAERQLAEADAARAALERQREEAGAEYSHQILSELAKAEQEESEQRQDLVKAQRTLTETELRAPIDGVVQQLMVHTLGGVVTPAQQLLVIVPEGLPLLVEATVANADVGFVRPGQDVELKVETFNFTRYGLVHGRVMEISPDVVTPDNRSSDNPRSGMVENQAETANRSPSYVARIALGSTHMTIDGKVEPLKPGMAVTAEIKTGSRRIIQYILSPLRQYAQDAVTER